MTATTNMITTWSEVRKGDQALVDGRLRTVTGIVRQWRDGLGEQMHVIFPGELYSASFFWPTDLVAVRRCA
jgi:hypothetical protein